MKSAKLFTDNWAKIMYEIHSEGNQDDCEKCLEDIFDFGWFN